MPSLREMREDIPLLAAAVLKRQCEGRQPPRLAPEAQAELARYDFPGNVRELENILERALALATGEEIEAEDLQLAPRAAAEETVEEIATGCRCRSAWTRSSARRSSTRSRKRTTTAPRLPKCWASRSARCAIAWNGSASKTSLTRKAERAGESLRVSAEGLAAGCSLRPLAQLRRTAGGDADRAPRDPRDQPAAGRIRRARHRRAFPEPARSVTAPLLRRHCESQSIGAFSDSARRHARSVRALCEARMACRRIELARALRAATIFRSVSSSKAQMTLRSSPVSMTSPRELTQALRAAYPIVDIAGHSEIAPGRKTDPGPHFDWSRFRAAAQAMPRRESSPSEP